nr:MAG TPA: hypothetical protein [Caudoviricetes sp.]
MIKCVIYGQKKEGCLHKSTLLFQSSYSEILSMVISMPSMLSMTQNEIAAIPAAIPNCNHGVVSINPITMIAIADPNRVNNAVIFTKFIRFIRTLSEQCFALNIVASTISSVFMVLTHQIFII